MPSISLISARVLPPLVAIAALAAGTLVVLDRMAQDGRAAERRALLARDASLTAQALAPGSALSCLDGGAGDTVETACELAVFADAASASRAVAYMAARIAVLWDAHELAEAGGDDLDGELAGTRRAVALDRFGIAASVLAEREGCTADACDAFALIDDATTLKANLKLRVFDQYVARHAVRWNAVPAEKAPPSVSEAPSAPPANTAAVAEPPAPGKPLAKQWDFPSAASIPPVSIMNSEPPRPKEGADAQAAQPAAAAGESVPVPPKRPQAPQAAEAPAR